MKLDLNEIFKSNASSEELAKNVSSLTEVLNSLNGAVSTLQTIKDTETNSVFKTLEVSFPKGGIDFHRAKKLYEVNLIKQALRETDGHQANAAKLLRMRTSTLNSIIKKNRIAYEKSMSEA